MCKVHPLLKHLYKYVRWLRKFFLQCDGIEYYIEGAVYVAYCKEFNPKYDYHFFMSHVPL